MRLKVGSIIYQTSDSKGQELVAQNIVREFNRQNHQAFLITSPYHDDRIVIDHDVIQRNLRGYIREDSWRPDIPLIRVDGYRGSWPPRRIMFRNFVDIVSKISEDFDLNVLITHSTLWNGPEDTSKYVAWRRMMKNVGLEQRDIIYCYMPHFQSPDPRHYAPVERAYRMAWNSLVLPQIFRTANLLLVVSPAEQETMVRLGAPPEQCILFPGGVDSESFNHYRRSGSDIRDKYSIPGRAKLVTFIGTLENRKNPLGVAKVARGLSTLKDVHFVIAGRPGDQFTRLKLETRDLKNVTIIGELSDREKVQFMKTSYLNLIMSRLEALGLTQLEFMYNGVPVITSAVGGQGWIVRDGLDGVHLKGPEDIEGACVVIRKLVSREESWLRMSKSASKRAREFTLTKLIRRLETRLAKFL